MVLIFDQSSPALVFYASSSSSPECVCVCLLAMPFRVKAQDLRVQG